MHKLLLIPLLFFFLSNHTFAQADSNIKTNPPGSNIIYAIPMQFTEDGMGLGLSAEHLLGRNARFSVCMPVMITFNVANSNRVYNYNTGNYTVGVPDRMLYAIPGIKYYPWRQDSHLSYATGLGLEVANGQQSSYFLDYNGLNTTELVQRHFLMGVLWQNYLQLALSRQVYVGADAGIGGTFVNKANDKNEGNETLAQGSLKIGYRF